MTPAELLKYMRTHRLAVQASIGAGDTAQAALVGIGVTDAFELVFDTLASSRKARNLRRTANIAFVLGGWLAGEEQTIQYEGVADEPTGDDLERLKAVYFASWPDGPTRASWPGLVYFRVRPTWIRYSDFRCTPPTIIEFTGQQLGA
jgi:hypothetical protein